MQFEQKIQLKIKISNYKGKGVGRGLIKFQFQFSTSELIFSDLFLVFVGNSSEAAADF
jgi:hypothetical protein